MTDPKGKDEQAWELACKRWNGKLKTNEFVEPGSIVAMEDGLEGMSFFVNPLSLADFERRLGVHHYVMSGVR